MATGTGKQLGEETNTSRDLKQASIISPPILSNHRAFLCSNSICSQSIRKITQYRSYLTAKQDPSTMDHINQVQLGSKKAKISWLIHAAIQFQELSMS